MIRITRKGVNDFNNYYVITSPTLWNKSEKLEKKDRTYPRPHIMYYYQLNQWLYKTDGKIMGRIKTYSELKNKTFYEIIKRNRSEIIFNEVEAQEDMDYPDVEDIISVKDESEKFDNFINGMSGDINSPVYELVKKNMALLNLKRLIDILDLFDSFHIKFENSENEPVFILDKEFGYTMEFLIMPLGK